MAFRKLDFDMKIHWSELYYKFQYVYYKNGEVIWIIREWHLISLIEKKVYHIFFLSLFYWLFFKCEGKQDKNTQPHPPRKYVCMFYCVKLSFEIEVDIRLCPISVQLDQVVIRERKEWDTNWKRRFGLEFISQKW